MKSVSVIVLAMVPLLAVASAAQAGTLVSFTLDPGQSSISVEGDYEGIPFGEQGAGSMTTSYSGTVDVDLDNLGSPTAITFLSAAADAAVSGNWMPEAEGGTPGSPNSGPADYGLYIDLGAAGEVWGALRDLLLDGAGGPLAISGGAFPSTQTLTVTTGFFDYNVDSPLGDEAARDDLAGAFVSNAAADGALSIVGSDATLTMPVDVTIAADTATVRLYGTLVGMAVVPEPSTLVMLLVGGATVLAFIAGRRRKRC